MRGRSAVPLALLVIHALSAPAGEPGGVVRTVVGTVGACDAEKGRLVVVGDDGKRKDLRFDEGSSLVFEGLYPRDLRYLGRGTRVEVDFRPAAGGVPLVTWVEVLPAGGKGRNGERR